MSSAGSEEEDSGSEAEGLDDWLVGDDDVEYEPGAVPDQPPRSISPSLPNGGKRKLEVEKEKEKDAKKRRIVKALVPYSTGPHWEDSVGDCQDHLRNYRIQLLNGMRESRLNVGSCSLCLRYIRHTLPYRSIHLHIGRYVGARWQRPGNVCSESSRPREICKARHTRWLCYSSLTSASTPLFPC